MNFRICRTWQLLLFLGIGIQCLAQSIEEIKEDRRQYIWGEGTAATINRADKEALSMLISQISVHVESQFTLLKEGMLEEGEETVSETCQSIVSTYSDATLKNTERIVISNEPNAKVFRYIKRVDVAKVFEDRKDKIIGFARNAEKAQRNLQIADALRYYYWSFSLLKSHPNGADIKFTDRNGDMQLLSTWLPMQINTNFSNTEIRIAGVDKKKTHTIYNLKITYNGTNVENFDYSFWDGSDWSNIISARDGLGQVELFGMSAQADYLKIKAEYIFEGEANMDAELKNVLEKLAPIPFRQSYYTVKLDNTIKNKGKNRHEEFATESNRNAVPLSEVQNHFSYEKKVEEILGAIESKSYEDVQTLFTEDGYAVFCDLIAYGNARVIGKPEMKYIIFHNKVLCRSVPMMFTFKANNKQFVENVVFHFNKEEKIENLTFALSEIALNDILSKDVWAETDRLTLVNFLENYKTAYALKRLNYIEHIFSDDALIITGRVITLKPDSENPYQGNTTVRYNRQTKSEYIKNLQHSFKSKEYINIKFEDSRIRKAGIGGNVYGVQIRQSYCSSNYGDVGYLFLMVDLNNATEPLIHVRTWQPYKGASDSVIGLQMFH